MANDKSSASSKSSLTGALGNQLIPINRLHLDLANYRHEEVSNEAQAIAVLCGSEQIVELAEDIGARGSLNPLDVLGVVPMTNSPGHFVAVEGNRRTCALIIAADPSRAPERFRSRLEEVGRNGSFPNRVAVHVFPDKNAAKQWIDLRHLGPQGGIGVKPWSPTQKSRAAAGNHRTSAGDNALTVSVLDRLVRQGLLGKDERSKVSVSTITRYLSSPAVREILGLGNRTDLIYTHDAKEVDSALLRFVRDSITPAADGSYPVNSRSNVEQRKQYANQLKAEGATPSTRLPEPAPPGAIAAMPNPRAKASPKQRNAPNPDARRYLIPTDFVVPIKDNVMRRLRGEAASLDVEDYSFCANFLLRAVVERALGLLVKKRGKWREGMTDGQLMQACVKELQEMGAPRNVSEVLGKAAGSTETPYSLHSLGFAIHGGSIPTGRDLKRYFDTWRPVLDYVLGSLEDR